jgi:hypothetical protein
MRFFLKIELSNKYEMKVKITLNEHKWKKIVIAILKPSHNQIKYSIEESFHIDNRNNRKISEFQIV